MNVVKILLFNIYCACLRSKDSAYYNVSFTFMIIIIIMGFYRKLNIDI